MNNESVYRDVWQAIASGDGAAIERADRALRGLSPSSRATAMELRAAKPASLSWVLAFDTSGDWLAAVLPGRTQVSLFDLATQSVTQLDLTNPALGWVAPAGEGAFWLTTGKYMNPVPYHQSTRKDFCFTSESLRLLRITVGGETTVVGRFFSPAHSFVAAADGSVYCILYDSPRRLGSDGKLTPVLTPDEMRGILPEVPHRRRLPPPWILSGPSVVWSDLWETSDDDSPLPDYPSRGTANAEGPCRFLGIQLEGLERIECNLPPEVGSIYEWADALSASGTHAVVVGPSDIGLLDLSSGAVQFSETWKRGRDPYVLSSTGHRFALISDDVLLLYDGTATHRLALPYDGLPPWSLTFGLDGERLAVSDSRTIRVFEVSQLARLPESVQLLDSLDDVSDVEVHGASDRIVVHFENGATQHYDLGGREIVTDIELHEPESAISPSPDGRFIALTDVRKLPRIQTVGPEPSERIIQREDVGRLVWHPSGRWMALVVATFAQAWVEIRDAVTLDELARFECMSVPVSLSFSADGLFLAWWEMGGQAQVWTFEANPDCIFCGDVGPQEEQETLLALLPLYFVLPVAPPVVSEVACNAFGAWFLDASGGVHRVDEKGRVKTPLPAQGNPYARFSPGAKLVVRSGQGGTEVFDTTTNERVWSAYAEGIPHLVGDGRLLLLDKSGWLRTYRDPRLIDLPLPVRGEVQPPSSKRYSGFQTEESRQAGLEGESIQWLERFKRMLIANFEETFGPMSTFVRILRLAAVSDRLGQLLDLNRHAERREPMPQANQPLKSEGRLFDGMEDLIGDSIPYDLTDDLKPHLGFEATAKLQDSLEIVERQVMFEGIYREFWEGYEFATTNEWVQQLLDPPEPPEGFETAYCSAMALLASHVVPEEDRDIEPLKAVLEDESLGQPARSAVRAVLACWDSTGIGPLSADEAEAQRRFENTARQHLTVAQLELET